MSGVSQESEYMKLLEELVRGVALKKPNETTGIFA
jgi:hypothetical protein